MTELGTQIKEEIETLHNYFHTPEGKQKRVERILALVEELDGNYEALRTAVLDKQVQRTFNATTHYDSKSGIVVGIRDDVARDLGLRYGSIE
jgi:translation elongation factor EF-Ts